MTINLRGLIGKLNAPTRNALESAAGLCLSRTHYDVEIEHFLLKALDASDGDLAFILKHYGVNRSRLTADLTKSLDKLKSGNARTPALSPTLTKTLSEAWLIGSVDYGAEQIRTGHAMVALATNDELRRLVVDISREFDKIAGETLRKDFETIVAQSAEEAAAPAAAPGEAAPRRPGGKTPNLDLYTYNLTERAKQGVLDAVLGRDFEVRQVVDILTRRRQNNPILVGGAAGQGDAATLPKPALARGELRTIAATTWSEYKKYFEKDPALARRFQLVKVEEPSENTCMLMMRAVVPALEKHHKVRILDEGMEAGVRLSHRYLPERQLPDKAVSVLDTACARLSLGQNAIPASLEDAMRTVDDIAVQTRVLERETAVGADHATRLAELAEARTEADRRVATLKERWEKERDLVSRIRAIRDQLEGTAAGGGKGGDGSGGNAKVQRAELNKLTAELATMQGQAPLVPVVIDANLIGQVISGWTGIPVGKMLRDEVQVVLSLERHLESRIIGQAHALEGISRRIRTSRAGIEDPNKPVGVFLLVGPSGVGKTETALALSDLLYGGERNLITINMSEFQEPHTVSTLKGSPPGYVGYGEGGVLTEAVRRRPYSVVLLDEVEKAHPDVMELFYQVFDKGTMEDGEGRQIDFKNNILVLTTNAGTETLMKLTADPDTMPDAEGLVKALKPELNKIFKPALLGRTVIIPYFPIKDDAMKQIIRLKLGKVERRLKESHKVLLKYDDAVVDAIAQRCTEVESGARNVDNILTNSLLPEMSRLLLVSFAEGAKPDAIRVALGEGGAFTYAGEAAAAEAPVAVGAT